MGLLTRDAILSASDLTFEDVDVPEWGGTVRVRMLTGAERDLFESGTVVRRGKRVEMNLVNVRARLVALTAIDEGGQLLFTQADVEALAKKSAAGLNRVFEAARKLNGLTEEDTAEAAAVFPPGQNGDSISD
jgi:hypothetical protein